MQTSFYTLIQDSLIQSTIQKATQSPRKRINHNFHELTEVYQRFLNVLIRGTYVRPHRHFSDPKPETFLSIHGVLGFLLFRDDGSIKDTFKISHTGPIYGIDLKPGVWHSLVALTDVCVCFEGKSGPYDPIKDKEFMDIYPEEGDPSVSELLSQWESFFDKM